MQKILLPMMLLLVFIVLPACSTKHEVEIKPVEIKPIHITIDVNIRVEKALDDFFGDLDKKAEKIKNQ
jgi:hypothetical protein